MKKDIENISDRLPKIIIMIGVVVGFIALTLSVPFADHLPQCDQQEQGTEDEGEEENQEVLKAFEAIHSTGQISLHHEYLLLETLPSFAVEDDEKVPSDCKVSTAGSKVLKILFRRIISPNAP